MIRKYLHFTDKDGAEGIINSKTLWQASFGPVGSIFAVAEGGAWVPSVQMTSLGRAKERNVVVVFTTHLLPDLAYPEEVTWHLDSLPVNVVDIIIPEQAEKMLTNSIPEDKDLGLLEILLHPAFNIMGDWVRMPEDFDPWLPGKDNEKYIAARNIWSETKNIEDVRDFWQDYNNNQKIVAETKKLIKFLLRDL